VHVDATETVKIMTEYLRKPGAAGAAVGPNGTSPLIGGVRLQSSATLNAIIVSGTAAQIQQVETKVRGLDTPDANAPARFRIIPLQRGVDPKDFATRVEKLFNEAQQGLAGKSGDFKPGKISVIADYTGPSLIVTGTPQMFDDVEKLVQQLKDQHPGDREPDGVFVRLKTMDPAVAQRLIKQMVDQRTGTDNSGHR